MGDGMIAKLKQLALQALLWVLWRIGLWKGPQ